MILETSGEESMDWSGLGWKIILCCSLLLGVGAINGLWTQMDYQSWYEALIKPSFSPPPSPIVGLIWSLMYITMGVSVGIIWQIAVKTRGKEQSKRAKTGIALFLVQILVNMIVPIFFFAVQSLTLLLLCVLLNFLLLLGVIRIFYSVHKAAAYILIPFLFWLMYAIVLDSALLLIN